MPRCPSGPPRGPACVAAALCAGLAAACGGAPAAPPAVRAEVPAAATASAAGEAMCTTAPLRARVVSLRQEAADSVRIEVALTNLQAPGTAAAADTAAVAAAVQALDGWSVLGDGGLRRAFPLRAEGGGRVGIAAEVPPPGTTRTFWAAFPRVDGPVSVLLPGFPPMPGLVIPPVHGVRPEP